MKIAFVHYTLGIGGGVNTVMRTNAKALITLNKNTKINFIGSHFSDILNEKNVSHINISELGVNNTKILNYNKINVFDYIIEGKLIYKKLSSVLKYIDYVIIENPIIGLHPPATYAFYRLVQENGKKKEKRKIIYRIHDFPQDRKNNFLNLLKFTGKNEIPHWKNLIFPRKNKFGYIALNSSDYKRLRNFGIKEKNKIFVVPNSISEDLIQKDKKISEKLRWQIIKKKRLSPNVKFLFYPVRVIPRKNIEEALFLTIFLNNYLNENYHLLVSLIETKYEESDYANTIQKFVNFYKLPATFGLNVKLKREIINGKIKNFGVGDAYNICDKVITTSILEGFGIFFIESWYFERAIIGRDLPSITMDFNMNKINMNHLYKKLIIGNKDFKDIPDLKERLKLSLKLKNKKFTKKVYENNKKMFDSMLKILKRGEDKKLIQENKKQVIKHYSSMHIARQLMNALRNICK